MMAILDILRYICIIYSDIHTIQIMQAETNNPQQEQPHHTFPNIYYGHYYPHQI
jgi:hypothetical protein